MLDISEGMRRALLYFNAPSYLTLLLVFAPRRPK